MNERQDIVEAKVFPMKVEAKTQAFGVQRNSQRFRTLRQLGCFLEVDRRIRAGHYSLAEIARFVQQDRREYLHAKHISLVTMLQEYRNSLPPVEKTAVVVPVSFEDTSNLAGDLDELEVLKKLCDLQKSRLEMFFRTENQWPKLRPLKGLSDDFALHAKLLASLARLRHKIQQGGLPREIQRASAWIQEKRDREVLEAFRDPEIRALVENLIGKATENGVQEENTVDRNPFVLTEDIGRLKSLTCFPQVDRRVRHGSYRLREIAQHIQQDYGEWEDATEVHLEKVLRCYRASLSPGEVSPQTFHHAGERSVSPGVAELEEIIRFQLARVECLVEFEKQQPIPTPSREISREIAALAETLRTCFQLREDLGLAGKSTEPEVEFIAETERRYGKRVAEALKSPNSRMRILGVVDGIVRLRELRQENDRTGLCGERQR